MRLKNKMQQFNDLSIRGNVFADKFTKCIKNIGIDFATGLPCGELRYFIYNLSTDPSIMHKPGLSEQEAIAIAAGAWLGGKNPVVYMQNSGMFKASNDIGSILLAAKIPILMLVAYRGCPGEDATQHLATGHNTVNLLNGFDIKTSELSEKNIENIVTDSYENMISNRIPSAILVRRGWSGYRAQNKSQRQDKELLSDKDQYKLDKKILSESLKKIKDFRIGDKLTMMRDDALDIVCSVLNEKNAMISTTGLISRSLYTNHDSSNQFYNAGGFGHTSSIAYGFACARPDIHTVAIDGDGSVLTNFATFVTIGVNKPKNLLHILLDNHVYESCSRETTLSYQANIPLIAAMEGYENIMIVNNDKSLEKALKLSKKNEGPTLIYGLIQAGGTRNLKRPIQMADFAQRFRTYFHLPT